MQLCILRKSIENHDHHANQDGSNAYSLAERSALTDSDSVTLFDTESRRNVSGEVGVSLLVTGVFGDKVKVFSADDQRSVHLGRDDFAGQDTASDRDLAGEGAFLVCKSIMLESILKGKFALPSGVVFKVVGCCLEISRFEASRDSRQ